MLRCPFKHRVMIIMLALATSAGAQATDAPGGDSQAGCPPGTIPNRDFYTLLAPPTPSENEGQNTGASSSTPGSADLLSRPLFTRLIQFAVENDLAKVGQGSLLTIDLNLFAFVGFTTKDTLIQQERYADFQWLRRLGGGITFGGKGEKIDQNGDGTPDEPKQASGLNDILSGELRWRAIGTHDTRDKEAFKKIQSFVFDGKSVLERQNELNYRYGEVFKRLTENLNNIQNGCLKKNALEGFLAEPQTRKEIADLNDKADAFSNALRAAVDSVKNSFVLTAAAGGTSRKQEFGADDFYAAVRASVGIHSFEFEVKRRSAFRDQPPQSSGRIGYELSVDIFKGTLLGPKGAKFSLAASYQRKDKSVMADEPRDLAQASGKLEVPVTDSIKIPLTIKFANHDDFLTDVEKLSGHVGIAVDLGGFKKGK